MGLDYKWFSTMWGVYLFAGSALNSMAVIILVAASLVGIADILVHDTIPEPPRQSSGRRGAVGNVEGDRLGAAAGCLNVGDDSGRAIEATVGMDDDVVAIGGQALADRGADAAAAAGDEGAFHDELSFSASRMTAARPSTRQRQPWLTVNW